MTDRNLIAKTLLPLSIFALAFAQAQGQSLSHSSTDTIYDNSTSFDISVFPGSAGYDGNGNSGTYGDGTILDYRFFNNSGPGDSFISTGYADGGAGIVGTATSTNDSGLNGGSLNWADAWTTNDPGVGFVNPANFTTDTLARSQGVTGTIDISGLESGSLDFIYGSFTNPNTIDLIMSGAGEPDILAQHTEDPPGRNLAWTSSFLFDNVGLSYDTISYSYTNTDTDGSRARFMGVIVDGQAAAAVPEPASIAIWSLIGLGLAGFGYYRTRRKK